MESPESKVGNTAESREREARIDQLTVELKDELLAANLLLPQVYSSINLFGSIVFLKAANEDIHYEEIVDHFSERLDEFGEETARFAETAHRAKNVPQVSERKGGHDGFRALLAGHAESSLECLSHFIDLYSKAENYNPEGNITTVVDFLENIKATLLSEEFRPLIRDFRNRIAKNRDGKWQLIVDLEAKWETACRENGSFDALLEELKDEKLVSQLFTIATSKFQMNQFKK